MFFFSLGQFLPWSYMTSALKMGLELPIYTFVCMCMWVCQREGGLALLFRVEGAWWGQQGFGEFRSRLLLAGSSHILHAYQPSARSPESHQAEDKHGVCNSSFTQCPLFHVSHFKFFCFTPVFFWVFQNKYWSWGWGGVNFSFPSALPILSEWLSSTGTINLNQDGMTVKQRHPQQSPSMPELGEATGSFLWVAVGATWDYLLF